MKKILFQVSMPFFISTAFAQNVGIGTATPLMELHVKGADSAVALLENTQALNTNVKNALYFKTGSGLFPYTGAIKTTGEGTSAARLGLFTFASTSANQLLERLSITDVGNVGIGTITPVAKLHVANSNVLFTAPTSLPASPGAPPQTGVGNRIYWYADKAAFRGGGIDDASWNTSIGNYSFCYGLNCTAQGDQSIAMGKWVQASAANSMALGFLANANGSSAVAINGTADGSNSIALNGHAVGDGSMTLGSYSFASGDNAIAIQGATASGNYSIAMGDNATASGPNSLCTGYNSIASGISSTATGRGTTAGGYISTALGGFTNASGDYSTAMGISTTASGSYSTAMGNATVASGSYSTAIGKDVSTNNFTGCLAIGDANAIAVTNCIRANEFRARFSGGYAFYTSAIPTTGVFMVAGSNAWSSISDSTKKEKFKKADGEYVLNSISKMRLGTWNYKQQNSKMFRHYGPMAQEFYNAFGNDGIGRIGCDTLINAADIDGVMMIALQALGKRSDALAAENKTLKANNVTLQNGLDLVKNEYATANKILSDKLALLEIKLNEVLVIKENASKTNLVLNK